ncbi:MAG: HAMP domain-containing sensor histidine kinase [Verrucomicrobiota bacterium]
MKKAVLIFILAVLLPALLLGYLSLQSARQQGVLIEDQEARLRQQQADTLAAQVALAIRVEHERFVQSVEELSAQYSSPLLAQEFNRLLGQQWDRAGLGFSVSEDGSLLSPQMAQQARQAPQMVNLNEQFIFENSPFIEGKTEADVYNISNAGIQSVQQEQLLRQRTAQISVTDSLDFSGDRNADTQKREEAVNQGQALKILKGSSSSYEAKRRVVPQNNTLTAKDEVVVPDSALNVTRSTFRDLVAGEQGGIISRFVDNRLEILFWTRLAADGQTIYGARIYPEDFGDVITRVVQESLLPDSEVVTAVLNDRAGVEVVFPNEEQKSSRVWNAPFVASEVGEVLPHWEVAFYLQNPDRLTRTARISSWTISGLILVSLLAIMAGGVMVMGDTRRQLELARKKTDFVSNVSHELKTPLTSIRMFAELLRDKRVEDQEKEGTYLNIITVEAERLTRLINNVLDFSRMERQQKTYQKEPMNLYALLETVWNGQELHLQQEGYTTQWYAEEGPYPVLADADAMAQILVNLISNAEKYSDSEKSIELHSYLVGGEVRVAVMDRGSGVPAGDEQKIFEHFYRAHDSLASGIEGSGLGLTLAARIASDHGGRITFERREQGGSRFTLHLPLEN